MEKMTDKRAEALLMDWANLPEWPQRVQTPVGIEGHCTDCGRPAEPNSKFCRSCAGVEAAMQRLTTRYPEIFSELPAAPEPPVGLLHSVADALVRAWEAPDLRTREWYIFKMRESFKFDLIDTPALQKAMMQGGYSALAPEDRLRMDAPPPLTAFEQVMFHFHRIADRARRCGYPECPAPYFFAKKRWQKYCSKKCSAQPLREQKRRWWRENRGR